MFQSLKIYFAIVLSMIFWSFSFIWTRVAILSFQPMTLITLRLVLASALLFGVLKLTKRFQLIRKSDIKLFLFLALFEPFLYYVGETFGLTRIESTPAAVIISTIPLFAPIFAFIFLRERVGWTTILGIVLSLIGVFFVIYERGNGFNANPIGVALMFMAVFSAIGYATILKKIPSYYNIFYQSLFGLIYFIPTFLLTDLSSIQTLKVSNQSLLALIMLAIFASVIAFVLFAGAVRKVGVSRTNVFVNLIPVFTAIFSWMLLDEVLTLWKGFGIAIVVAGLFVSQWNSYKIGKITSEDIL